MFDKRKYMKKYGKKYLAEHPWVKTCWSAKSRCDYKYGSYFGKVKFLMTSADFKTLWFRDKAYLLKRPSIHRINNNGNYTLKNCRYIELLENASLGNIGFLHHTNMPVLQYSLEGKFIRKWESQRAAERGLGLWHYEVGKCCKGKGIKQIAGGYIWKSAGKKLLLGGKK